MFGISGGELIILLLIGLVVLGPQRLPRVANQIGSWLGQARRMTRVMKRQLEEELDLNDTFNIKPPSISRKPASQSKQDEPSSQADEKLPRDDDDYSPAHGADDTGTGVGEEIDTAEKGPAGAEPNLELVAEATDGVTEESGDHVVDKKAAS